MKLTLQLVVVVLKAQTNFRDSFLKFTLHTRHKVRGTWHLGRHAPFSNTTFLRNSTSNGK